MTYLVFQLRVKSAVPRGPHLPRPSQTLWPAMNETLMNQVAMSRDVYYLHPPCRHPVAH